MANGDNLFTPDTLNELGQYLTQNGANPAQVANDLGVNNTGASPGAIAHKRLENLKMDPEWRHKYFNGDVETAAEFHRLTGLIALQKQKDDQEELKRSGEAIAAIGRE